MVMMSQSAPWPASPNPSGFIGPKLAPPSVDLATAELRPLIAEAKMQLCESTLTFGSLRPSELGMGMLGANVATVGSGGGAYAVAPETCLVYQVRPCPPSNDDVLFTSSVKAMLALPSGSRVTVKYSARCRSPVHWRPSRQMSRLCTNCDSACTWLNVGEVPRALGVCAK